jgi:hypothetical protein
MNERDKEIANQVTWYADVTLTEISRYAALIRADERADLIKFFEQHLRSDWSDDQIIEALEARGNT